MRKSIAITLILTVILSLFAVIPSAMAAAYYIRTDNGKTVNLREDEELDFLGLSSAL